MRTLGPLISSSALLIDNICLHFNLQVVAEEEVVFPVQVEETVDVDRQIWENQQLLIQLLVQIHLLIGSKFVLNQRYVFCRKNGILNTKGE